ncbi:hypothetical protein [Chryseobacterium wangxinyae]|uniref:hypothetical protein n=1 Tax=Chryseobacterium sp. CY353 TaxID=2997334 RepID=UPI00226DBDB3|nr:hypothetical protein [Chryseobacterium sp. CY353]MCY0967902.1 hypothetical protein [Chryseobacterium sp. CY353]
MKIIINMFRFILKNLNTIHAGVGFEKIFASIKIAVIPALFMSIVEGLSKWYIVNQWFMIFVFYAIIIDHVLGSIVHAFIKKDFTLKKNGIGLLIKISFCITGYSLFVMIPEILKGVPFLPEYLTMLIQLIVFIWPAGSAMGNMSILTGGRFPPIGWMKKIERFQENADITEFKNIKNESNTDNS